MSVLENLRGLEERIDAARRRAGRRDAVTLVAVTKGRGPALVREALEAGVGHVGENRVQEARVKWPALADEFRRRGVRRHMVGHLQRNKVAAALELFDLVQSVDSVPLARKISEHAARGGRVPVLLQLNAGGEETKSGFELDDFERQLPDLAELSGLAIAGLMTLAPLDAGEARLRAIFGGTRERFERLRAELPGHPVSHLSMGMSGDFEIAVEEGATLVRIGTALFAGAEVATP
ncbi:MAG TPA: YggS family pyridoxal phosphate-dependent enzyme [Gemmatimonadota bacterium]|jgi:pyridoxal phosphate enzyme (YggS family)